MTKSQQKVDFAEWPIVQNSAGSVVDHYAEGILRLSSESKAEYAAKQNGKWGVIDNENRLYFPFEYDTIVSNRSSIALKKLGEYEVYDTARTLLASIKADNLRPIFADFYTSEQNSKLALVNPNGMLILDHRFDQISGPKDESYFLGMIEGDWAAYDMAGAQLDTLSRAREAVRWLIEYSVSLKAYGPLKIGMDKEQIERTIGWELTRVNEEGQCEIYSLGTSFLDVQLMLNKENGGKSTLERIYIYAPGVLTRSGIGLGSTKQTLLDAYGDKITMQESANSAKAQPLFYVPTDRKDKNYRLNFLHRNGVIESFSVGRLPSIEFGDGCF